MTDQLKLLPPFTWRDVQYPVVRRSMNFSHESVEHKWQRRNGDFVEQTGAHNPVYSYDIPMRADLLDRLGYGNIFAEGLQQLLDDCRDKKPGELFDPRYGLLTCVPTSFTDDLDAAKRDGTDIRVEFKHAPESEFDDIALTPISAISEAESLAVEATALQVSEEEAQEISPNNSIKLTDALRGLAQTGQAILATPADIRAEVGKIAFWAKEIEDVVEQSVSPDAILTRHRARETRDRASRVLENGLQIRPVRTELTQRAQSLSSLAAEFKVDFQAFLSANSALASRPIVPVGTLVVIPDAS